MKRTIVYAYMGMLPISLVAQVGIGTAMPHASAQLEISATNKGLLIPRILYADRPSSPAAGLLIYQTDNIPGFYFHDGSAWQPLGNTGWNLNGNANASNAFLGTTNGSPLQFKVNNEDAGSVGYSFSYPTSLGYRAAKNNSGSYVTVIGYEALSAGNGGNYVTAVGGLTLRDNTTGYFNAGLGSFAMRENTTGHDNTAAGHFALGINETGSENTAVGSMALVSLTGGDKNTAVGAKAGVGSGTFTNTTAIGAGALVTASNMVRVGNADVTQIGGAVGWSVLSDVRFKTGIQPQVHGLDFIMRLQPITYHIDARKLSRFLAGDKAVSVYAGIAEESVQRKQNILYSGFSAQQVEEAATAVQYDFSGIHRPESEKDHYSLEYAAFVVPLVKAMQEQQAFIEQLKKDNDTLKKELMEIRQWSEKLLKQLQQAPVRTVQQ